jgi:tetratricopeptide (TPR) repeat protein
MQARLPYFAFYLAFLSLSLLLTACAGILPPSVEGISNGEAGENNPTLGEEVREVVGATPTTTLDDLLANGQDLANQGDWDRAVALYQLAISIDSENSLAFQLRGDAHQAQANFTQAIADYDEAIRLDPLSASGFNRRGLAHRAVGDFALAIADFNAAVGLQPGFGLAYRNRADLHIAEERFEAAVLDLQIYLAFAPDALDRPMVEAKIIELQGGNLAVVEEDGLLYFDDFSNEDSGWYSNGDPSAVSEYDAGGYRIVVRQESSAVWALPGRLFSHVSIEVSAEKQSGDDDNFFGIMCRVQGSTDTANFYLLMISSDGYYGIAKRVDGGELALIGESKMQFSEAINQGSDLNRVRADCIGETLSLYANDVKLTEVVDGDLSTGQVGLLAGSFAVPGTNILFDDLSVSSRSNSE